MTSGCDRNFIVAKKFACGDSPSLRLHDRELEDVSNACSKTMNDLETLLDSIRSISAPEQQTTTADSLPPTGAAAEWGWREGERGSNSNSSEDDGSALSDGCMDLAHPLQVRLHRPPSLSRHQQQQEPPPAARPPAQPPSSVLKSRFVECYGRTGSVVTRGRDEDIGALDSGRSGRFSFDARCGGGGRQPTPSPKSMFEATPPGARASFDSSGASAVCIPSPAAAAGGASVRSTGIRLAPPLTPICRTIEVRPQTLTR